MRRMPVRSEWWWTFQVAAKKASMPDCVKKSGAPWGPYAYGPYVYREGMIGIDLFDGRTHEALWHASVDQNLYGATGADAERRIDAAVTALFAHFPT